MYQDTEPVHGGAASRLRRGSTDGLAGDLSNSFSNGGCRVGEAARGAWVSRADDVSLGEQHSGVSSEPFQDRPGRCERLVSLDAGRAGGGPLGHFLRRANGLEGDARVKFGLAMRLHHLGKCLEAADLLE